MKLNHNTIIESSEFTFVEIAIIVDSLYEKYNELESNGNSDRTIANYLLFEFTDNKTWYLSNSEMGFISQSLADYVKLLNENKAKRASDFTCYSMCDIKEKANELYCLFNNWTEI